MKRILDFKGKRKEEEEGRIKKKKKDDSNLLNSAVKAWSPKAKPGMLTETEGKYPSK